MWGCRIKSVYARKVGDVVNLENDIVGKYIEKFITFEKEKPKSGITKEFLLKNGF